MHRRTDEPTLKKILGLPAWDLNPNPSEYKSDIFTTQLLETLAEEWWEIANKPRSSTTVLINPLSHR